MRRLMWSMTVPCRGAGVRDELCLAGLCAACACHSMGWLDLREVSTFLATNAASLALHKIAEGRHPGVVLTADVTSLVVQHKMLRASHRVSISVCDCLAARQGLSLWQSSAGTCASAFAASADQTDSLVQSTGKCWAGARPEPDGSDRVAAGCAAIEPCKALYQISAAWECKEGRYHSQSDRRSTWPGARVRPI